MIIALLRLEVESRRSITCDVLFFKAGNFDLVVISEFVMYASTTQVVMQCSRVCFTVNPLSSPETILRYRLH